MPAINLTPTERGFLRGEFTERNGAACSIQKSSIATEDCIWLGANAIGLTYFVPGRGWTDVSEEKLRDMLGAQSVLANTRMHLTKQMVGDLLPILDCFQRTGELAETAEQPSNNFDTFCDQVDHRLQKARDAIAAYRNEPGSGSGDAALAQIIELAAFVGRPTVADPE